MKEKTGGQEATQPIFAVEMRGITKRFGALAANQDVDFRARAGDIHALIGENGAGKSTLMSVLYGLHAPEAGEILIHGRPVRLTGPAEAIAQGVGMVHQHFMLVPTLTVTENVVLGMEPELNRGLRWDRARAEKTVRTLSGRYGLELDARAKVSELTVGQQQRLEILKVLYRNAEILILDEPTAVLTPQETARLFEILKGLRAQGKTVILITHKLQEVATVADAVTVMRKGKVVGTAAARETTQAQLAAMMVGRSVLFHVERKVRTPAEIERSPVLLRLEGICAAGDRGTAALQNVSLDVHAGEILGVAGVEGNGQTELVEVVAGLRRPASGTIRFLGVPRSPAESAGDRLRMGLAHIPEDRHKRGLVLDYSVAENMVLGLQRREDFGTPWRADLDRIHRFAERLSRDFDVHPQNADAKIRTLSGGNQQKVVVARELARVPRLLIAAQPTRGVDVGAIEFIHKKIVEARDSGAGVLLVSAELSEILSLSDRVAVLYRGKIMGVLPSQKCTEEKLGLMMAGGQG